MDASSEIKSKYFALVFTIGLHAILLVFFLMTVFTKPVQESFTMTDSYFPLDMNADQGLTETKMQEIKPIGNVSIAIVSQNKNGLTSRVTDPNETGFGASTKPNDQENQSTEKDLESALTRLKKIKHVGDSNADVTSRGTINKEIDSGNNTNLTTDPITTVILNGRRLIKKPEAITDSKEEGIVAVEIIVDENGNVIRAIPGQRGSTITDATLFEKAKQKALEAKFDKSAGGIKEQRGTYTFVFTLQ
ncbi:MAG: hypothetical protein ACXVPU_01290 [Bacteroidia bacterium]